MLMVSEHSIPGESEAQGTSRLCGPQRCDPSYQQICLKLTTLLAREKRKKKSSELLFGVR